MTTPTWKTTDSRSRLSPALATVSPDRLGFTLLELLLAIGLMGLLLGLTLPRVGAVKESYFAAEETQAVANFLRSAQDAAISRRTTAAVTIGSDERNILEERQLEVRSWHAGDSAGLVADSRDWQEIWEAPVARRTRISGRLRLEGTDQGILFFANGSSTGGEVLIEDEEGRTRCRFHIEASTGEVYVQK